MRSFSNIHNLPWKTCSHQSKSISTFSVSGFFDILEYADSAEFADRIDGFQTGILDVIRTTTGNVAHPWVQIYNNLERKYFDRITTRHQDQTSLEHWTEYQDNSRADYGEYPDTSHQQPHNLLENLNNYMPNFDSFRF